MHQSPGSRANPGQRRIDDISRALDTHPRWSGLVFQAERWDVALAVWNLTALPVHEHGPALRELCATLAPHDPSAIEPLCAAYRRALLRWGGASEASAINQPPDTQVPAAEAES